MSKRGGACRVEVEHDGLRLRVKIGGLLHAQVLDTGDMFGLRSWHVAHKYFAIEITSTDGAKMLLDYDDVDLWMQVLRGLEAALEGKHG